MESNVAKESKYFNLILLIISIWVFFNNFINGNLSIIILFFILTSLILNLMINRYSFKVTSNDIIIFNLAILFIILQVISISYSSNIENSIYRGILISSIIGIGLLLSVKTKIEWYKGIFKYMLVLSLFHGLITLIAFLFPNSFKAIILPFVPSAISDDIIFFMSNGYYSGITNQISINAFFITVGISILFCIILIKGVKYSKREIILFVLLFVALLLTGKRGHLLANIISMIFIILIYSKVKGISLFNKITKIVILLSIFFLVIVTLIPQASAPIQRFLEKQDGDISSGRYQLYNYAFDMFKEKPAFGWGTGTFSNIYGTGNHNLMLQLLSENGIFGFLIFMAFIGFVFTYTIKKYKKTNVLSKTSYDRYYLISIYMQMFFITYGMSGNVLNDEYIFLVYMISVATPFTLSLSVKNEVK